MRRGKAPSTRSRPAQPGPRGSPMTRAGWCSGRQAALLPLSVTRKRPPRSRRSPDAGWSARSASFPNRRPEAALASDCRASDLQGHALRQFRHRSVKTGSGRDPSGPPGRDLRFAPLRIVRQLAGNGPRLPGRDAFSTHWDVHRKARRHVRRAFSVRFPARPQASRVRSLNHHPQSPIDISPLTRSCVELCSQGGPM